jgi:hypothetical protein
MGGLTENSGPRDDHSIKPHNGFSASAQQPIYIHITSTQDQLLCVLFEEKKASPLGTRKVARHNTFAKVSRTLPFKASASIRTAEFFGTKFTRQKSKYGSVEPRNGIRVAELILCDVSKMALQSHIPYLSGRLQAKS